MTLNISHTFLFGVSIVDLKLNADCALMKNRTNASKIVTTNFRNDEATKSAGCMIHHMHYIHPCFKGKLSKYFSGDYSEKA